MNTLTDLLKELSKISKVEGLRLRSWAHGEVFLSSYTKDKIVCKNLGGEIFEYDENGKIHPAGMTVLYPWEGDWQKFLKKAYEDWDMQNLKDGEICLVKREYLAPWILAVYSYRLDGKIYAKTGKENETFEWCISWLGNKDYLGRESFPDWIDPGVEEMKES